MVGESGKQVELTVEADAVVRRLRRMGDRGPVILRKALSRTGAFHREKVTRNRFGPYRGKSYANKLQRRSGELINRTGFAVTGNRLENMRLAMFNTAEHALIQELGGTIRPKRGTFLTIPTRAALTPGGVQSGKFAIRRGGGTSGYTTDAGDTFLFKSRGGNFLIGIKDKHTGKAIAEGRGKNKQLKAFYILRRSVRIPPRFGFISEYKRVTLPFLNKELRTIARDLTGGTS